MIEINEDPLIIKAKSFGSEYHSGQTRRYTNENYFNHCIRVASMVAQNTEDTEVIAAALLHDVVEDTHATNRMVRFTFGLRVSQIVGHLTKEYTPENYPPEKYPTFNRKYRSMLEVERMREEMCEDAKLIKRFDIADNIKDIVLYDPKFAIVYLREKAEELEVVTS